MTVSTASSTSRKFSSEESGAIRAELAAILRSESFSGSKRCQDFLKFVVEHALDGDYDSLSERFLGVELFGRSVDYETATDSIVRVRANDVRRRLAQYYSSQPTPPTTRIDLIAGGYVPEFHWKPEPEIPLRHEAVSAMALAADQSPSPAALDSPPSPQIAKHRSFAKPLWGAALALTLIACCLAVLLPYARTSNFDRFWRPVLDAPSAPVINLPTTDTLQLTMDSMRTLGPISQRKAGDSITLKPGDYVGFHDWHVSLPVVQATLAVSLALGRKGKTPIVRIGTDLRRDEVRGHPIIAIGSFSNPWTRQNISGLRFNYDRGVSDKDAPRITDAQNPRRSWSLSQTYPDPQTKDYAIITRTFDPGTHEPFISLAGLHSFGNQMAAEFVSQNSSWNEVAQRAPRGWETMNLQIVLEADIVGTTPGSPRIVDMYFWK